MFGLSGKFYLKTIKCMDTISAIGLLSTTKSVFNKIKLTYSVLVSVLLMGVAFVLFNPLVTRSFNKLLNIYLTFYGFSGFICSAVLIIILSFRSEYKTKALLEAEFVYSEIKKHMITVSKFTALDFCKELLFIKLSINATLYIVLFAIPLHNMVTEGEVTITHVMHVVAAVFKSFLKISMFYSFNMLSILSLESFFIIKEEILATARTTDLNLSVDKVLPPVNETESPVFTIRSQSRVWDKDIRSNQIRTIIRAYCVLEDINTSINQWHSAPLTCLLTAAAIFSPTIPTNDDMHKSIWSFKPEMSTQMVLLLMLITSILSVIAYNVYYQYSKYKLINMLNKYIYRSRQAQVQRQLMNFALFLNNDSGAYHWKWLAIDSSLVFTIWDTSFLIFTTFLLD